MKMNFENDVIKVIKERRSEREFLPVQIEEEKIQLLLECAIYAPSAVNQQPWFFTVIQNTEVLDKMNEQIREIMLNSNDENLKKFATREDFNVFHHAPTVIIVSGKENNQSAQVDCAAATQNILLAAKSLGISSCWIGFVGILFTSQKADEYIELLKIPQGYKPLWAVAIGYAKNPSTPAPERKLNVFEWIR